MRGDHCLPAGKSYRFVTDAGISKGHVDEGTRLLIGTVEFPASGLICDLGCGYGPIGLVAQRAISGLYGAPGGCQCQGCG